MAHAKDIAEAEPGADHPRRVSPGAGCLDWVCYFRRLAACGYQGALIMHEVEESEMVVCRDRLISLAPEGTF